MPIVTAKPQSMTNGDMVTEFIDATGTTPTTYTFSTTQDFLSVKNNGTAKFTVTVGGTNKEIKPGEIYAVDVGFTNFTTQSAQGTQEISARAIKRKPSLDYTTDIKDFGAVGDGLTDDTVSIQKALDSANSKGGGIVLVPPGEYGIKQSIKIGSNTILQGSGTSSVIKALIPATAGSPLRMVTNMDPTNGNAGITVRDLKVDGQATTLSAPDASQNGIAFFKVTDSLITNVWVHNTSGYNIVCFDNSERVRILGNHVTDSLKEGIELLNAHRCIVANNTVKGCGVYGIYVWAGATRNVVQGNNVMNCQYGIGVQAGAEAGVYTFNNTIADNVINDCTADGIYVKGFNTYASEVYRLTISNNTIRGCAGNGIHLNTRCKYVILSGNMVSDNTQSGIRAYHECETVTITNNITRVNQQHGIFIYNTQKISVCSNVVELNGQDGIRLERNVQWGPVNGNMVASNSTLSSGNFSGIAIRFEASQPPCQRLNVVGNTCTDLQGTKNQAYGILETASNDYNVFADNILAGNKTGALSKSGTNSTDTANIVS